MITAQEFQAWLGMAPPGDAICYFKGDLMTVAEMGGKPPASAAAWSAHEEGVVDLVQLRIKFRTYLYLAIKRKKRRKV